MTKRWKYTGKIAVRLGNKPLVEGEHFSATDDLSRQLENMPQLFEEIKPKKRSKKGGDN